MAKFSILFLTLSLVLALSSMCSARDVLSAGQQPLSSGDELRSNNGQYSLRMQRDCNLVLYRGQGDNNPVWASNTGGLGSNCYLSLQPDGNLVVYTGRQALWASGTNGSGANTLIVQDDGNAVLYRPVWATNTGRVEFKFGSASGSGNASDDSAAVLELPH